MALTAAALGASLIPTAASAAPAIPPPVRIIPIISHAGSGAIGAADLDCAPPPAPDVTLVELTGITNIGTQPSDNFVGSDVWTGCFYFFPDGHAESHGTALFTGEIKSCGRGTIEIAFESFIEPIDPATGTRTMRGVDIFVPGSGTGGLTGVLGQYTTVSTVQADQSFTGVGRGIARCPVIP